jgi:HTH-type transcriptional regulator / antitoxin HigA
MIAIVIEKDTLRGIAAPRVITSGAQNERYIAALLEPEKKDRLSAKEKDFAELLTVLIEAYEEEHYPIGAANPVEVLVELMEANNHKQKDLAPLLGSEGVVSEVLRGKRELNKHHTERLSRRFRVSPAVFF